MKKGRVLLLAALALLAAAPAGLAKDEKKNTRPRVILAGFVNKTNEPEWIEYFVEDQNGERVRYVVDRWVETPRRILEELVKKRAPRVVLVDRRKFDQEVVKETKPAKKLPKAPPKLAPLTFLSTNSESLKAPARAKIAKRLGARRIVEGTVERFWTVPKSFKGYNVKIETRTRHCRVTVRVIDPDKNEVVYSDVFVGGAVEWRKTDSGEHDDPEATFKSMKQALEQAAGDAEFAKALEK